MIDKAKTKKLIAELRTLPFASVLDADAWGVLIDCLRERAEDEAHARRIIDECLALRDTNGMARMATVLDIRDIAYATRTTEVRPLRDCQKCGGSGYAPVVRGEYAGAVRCDCWRRQAIEDQPVYTTETPAEISELACRKTMATGERR